MSYNPANNFLTSPSYANPVSAPSTAPSARKEWTQPEIDYILKHRTTKSHKELADVVGRTTSAVAQKLRKLTQPEQSTLTQPTSNSQPANKSGKANDTESDSDSATDDDSTESESDHGDSDDEKQTIEAPTDDRDAPGDKSPKRKYKPWTDGDVKTLLALSTSKTFEEIAKILGRSKNSVSEKYRKLKKEQKAEKTITCVVCKRVFETERSLRSHCSRTKDEQHQKYRLERKSKEAVKETESEQKMDVDVKPEIAGKSKEKKKHKKRKKKDKKKEKKSKSDKKKRKKYKQKQTEMEVESDAVFSPKATPSSKTKKTTTFTAGDSTININFHGAIPGVSTENMSLISPKAASQQNQPLPSAESSSQEALQSTASTAVGSTPSIFNGKTFALCGRLSMKQSEMEALIIRNGGKIAKSPNTDTDFVVVKNQETNINNTTCQNAMNALKIPVIVEQFVHDSIAATKMLAVDQYRYKVKDEENEPKKAELDAFSSDDDDVMKGMPETEKGGSFNFFSDAVSENKKNRKRKMKAEDDGGDSEEPQRKRKKVDKLKWSADDVANWVCGLNANYKVYVQEFKEEKVTGELMDTLDEG